MAYFVKGDLELYYEVRGHAGPHLVLLAGLATDSQSWLPVMSKLAQRRRVIIVDNRGCGRTRDSGRTFTIEDMADDCLCLLDHLGITNADILGHSMGGYIAQELALRRPSYVRKLMLVSTTAVTSARNNLMLSHWAQALESGANSGPWLRNLFYWLFTRQFFSDPERLEAAVGFAQSYPYPQTPRDFRRQVDALARFDSRDRLPQVQPSTCVVVGSEDILVTPGETEALLEALPNNANYKTLPDAAHALYVEAPMRFYELVNESLG